LLKTDIEYLQEYFLKIVFVLLRNLSDKPLLKDLKIEIDKLINLFSKFTKPPLKTIQGLWAELLIIEQSKNPDYLIQSWHNSSSDKYDFNDGIDKIEVKSEGYLNNLELRFPNEPARHKLLDVIGDLALIGYPIKARIIANRPGHSTNVEFAKKIKQYIRKNKHVKNVPVYDPSMPSVYSLEKIEKTLPHRHPFLFVDKIVELTDTHIVGIKNVTFNEWFFPGHFPGNPVMPGVIQIEALAQTGGILCINSMPEGKYDTYFLKIDNCKFKQMVRPGDTMVLKMELNGPIRRGICEMRGTVFVGGKVATEADLVAQIVRRAD
jgi:UDP-3-O-[3-hydroxymyristoyl] N-acetylglucosamine deacetylase/3-hydroxyacyl-[acyl-carrier-protein] dehydratase